LDLRHAVSVRVFLTRFEQDYAPMNAVYRGYFPPDRLPARTCVGVTGLARGALVEIDLIARRGGEGLRLNPSAPSAAERVEGDQRVGVLHARQRLDFLGHEQAD